MKLIKEINTDKKTMQKWSKVLHQEPRDHKAMGECLKFILRTPRLATLLIQETTHFKYIFRFLNNDNDALFIKLIAEDQRLGKIFCALLKELLSESNLRHGHLNALEHGIYETISHYYRQNNQDMMAIINQDPTLKEMIQQQGGLAQPQACTGSLGSAFGGGATAHIAPRY